MALIDGLVSRGRRHRVSTAHPAIGRLLGLRPALGTTVTLERGASARLVTDLAAALEPLAAPALSGDPAERAVAFLAELPPDRCTVADLAACCAVSREHLSRCFQRRYGLPLRDHLLRHRLVLACQLLADPRRPCKEIAHAIGFASPAAFGRAFARTQGLSPERWRQGRRRS